MYCENQTCDTTKGDAFSEYIKTVDGMGFLASVYTRGKDKKVFLRITLITDTNLTKEGHFYPKKGRNAFFFLISDDFHAEPAVYGSDGSSSLLSEASKSSSIDLYCNPSNATKTIVSGNNCAARIVRDGWKVNY